MIERALFVFLVFLLVSIVVEQFYAKRIKMGPGVELRNGVFMMSDTACGPATGLSGPAAGLSGPVSSPGDSSPTASGLRVSGIQL